MSELKPCPFCNDTQEIKLFAKELGKRFLAQWQIECQLCGASLNKFNNKKLALYRWNTRPIEEKLRSENKELKNKIDMVKAKLQGQVIRFERHNITIESVIDKLVRILNELTEAEDEKA